MMEKDGNFHRSTRSRRLGPSLRDPTFSKKVDRRYAGGKLTDGPFTRGADVGRPPQRFRQG